MCSRKPTYDYLNSAVLCPSAPLWCAVNDSSAPGALNEAQPVLWRPTPPAAHVRPHSWLLSACTSCTCLEGARPRTSSRATGGRGCGTESGPPSAYCGGTSCTDARPPTPSLWWFGQNHLREKKQSCVTHKAQKIHIVSLFVLSGNANDTFSLATYVDKIRSVLTCHSKSKISPESRFLPYYLQIKRSTSRKHPDDICSYLFRWFCLNQCFSLPAFVEGKVNECGCDK